MKYLHAKKELNTNQKEYIMKKRATKSFNGWAGCSIKTIQTKAILTLICLFAGIFVNAQNPIITKADIINQFDISPDAKWVCCNWWGADDISKIRLKKLDAQESISIDSPNGKTKLPYVLTGVSFLSEEQLIYSKEKALFSYNFVNRHHSKLFDLPNDFIVYLVVVSKDGKTIFFVSDNNICRADVKTGILNKKRIGNHLTVRDISITADNQLIYSPIIRYGNERETQIWIWDGKSKVNNITKQFSKLIKDPYIVKATSEPNLYIVAGKEGIFRFDKAAQKATKLAGIKEDRVVEIRISNDNKTIYYLTYFNRAIIKTMAMDGKQGKSISF